MKNNKTTFVVASCSERELNIIAFNDFKDAVICALTPLQQDIIDNIDIDDVDPDDEDLISKINDIVDDGAQLEILPDGEQNDTDISFGVNINTLLNTCSVWSNLDDDNNYDAIVRQITITE